MPRHIIIRFSKDETKEKNIKGSQRERSDYLQREAHETNSGALCRNTTSQKIMGAKLLEEGVGSNVCCSAASASDIQHS